jgi:hypothetical protein
MPTDVLLSTPRRSGVLPFTGSSRPRKALFHTEDDDTTVLRDVGDYQSTRRNGGAYCLHPKGEAVHEECFLTLKREVRHFSETTVEQ